MDGEFIVGQITKGHVDGQPTKTSVPLLNVGFERMIAVNAQRGYELHSWQLGSVAVVKDGTMVCSDSIVAVFRRKRGADGRDEH